MTVSGEDLNARPITRPGEILEAAPGLMTVMHADAGKANQYYLRGWNLDHGTDLATFWDDIPINLPTHAHGQGYTDLNWLIPETVSGLDIRKGPYWADVGDFENAGNLHISVVDTVPQNIESVTVGSFDYQRYLTLGSVKAGGGNLLYAGEFTGYDGPWTNSDDMKKFSGLLRYSQGTATDGFSLTGMAYTNTWNLTDQKALRAYTTGQIGLYGELDPTDGGDTSRFSLSGRVAQTTDDGSWKANAYLVKYTMDLWNNYTWDTTDPINGDQFHQHDDRVYGGGGASRTFDGQFGGLPTETVFGVQSRDDDIITALNYSDQRQLLARVHLTTTSTRATPRSTPRIRCIGPTGCARSSAGAATITRPRSIQCCSRRIREIRRRPSAARNSAWWWGRSPRPNSLSAPAWAITATTRAARR